MARCSPRTGTADLLHTPWHKVGQAHSMVVCREVDWPWSRCLRMWATSGSFTLRRPPSSSGSTSGRWLGWRSTKPGFSSPQLCHTASPPEWDFMWATRSWKFAGSIFGRQGSPKLRQSCRWPAGALISRCNTSRHDSSNHRRPPPPPSCPACSPASPTTTTRLSSPGRQP